MKREVGGGIGMGNTCKPMAVSFQCMTEFTTNKKKKIVFGKISRQHNSDNLTHRDGEGGGRGIQDGEYMHTHGGFKSMYGKTNKML